MLETDERHICDSLLDQTIMPGVGNIIKCEGLFELKLNPQLVTKTIDRSILRNLVMAMHVFSLKWYSATKSRTPMTYRIYGSKTCKVCNSNVTLVRSGLQQRITYFCPLCQHVSCANLGRARDTAHVDHTPPCRLMMPSVSEKQPPSCIGTKRLYSVFENAVIQDASKWICDKCTFENDGPGYGQGTAKKPVLCSMCFAPSTNTTFEFKTQLQDSSAVPLLPSTLQSHSNPATTTNRNHPSQPLVRQPVCRCGGPTALHRVRKTGPTMNRLFWSCSSRFRSCGYFLWADTRFPSCGCAHSRLMILRRVLKEGHNNGRYFFCCAAEVKEGQCKAFMWTESHLNSITSSCGDSPKGCRNSSSQSNESSSLPTGQSCQSSALDTAKVKEKLNYDCVFASNVTIPM